MEEQKTNYDFQDFKRRVSRDKIAKIPLDEKSYSYYGHSSYSPMNDFTLKDILEIIQFGDIEDLRTLSRYYYRTNANYRNNIDFLAHLFLYDSVVIPILKENEGSEGQIIKTFYSACDFIDKMDLPNTLARIITEWLITGVYNGIMRREGNKVTIQDLPLKYCRSRFKDTNNLNILEFNLSYFDSFTDEKLREEALRTFPEVVQKAWGRWRTKKITDSWVYIRPEDGGISFSFVLDQTPLLIASIPTLKKLDDAISREEKRDENELYKLLIQRMPIDNGQLVFQLDEVADMHAAIANMLSDIETVDVLTTFGETSLESLQDSSNASQSADRINKYKNNAWDALGRSESLFNAVNTTSLAYMIKKDESIMMGYLNVFESWCKYVLNTLFTRKGLSFDFKILPTTVFNRQDLQQTYFRGAQYGYSKMFAGVAMGIKQIDQLSLMNFENDFLEMSTKMVPLQSSYTTSGNTITRTEKNNSQTAEKSVIKAKKEDLENTGGRPELPDEQKSDRTQANIESS